ncbi:MAG: hypothetical protein AAB250_01720 [Bdellovibrionota bacterium]
MKTYVLVAFISSLSFSAGAAPKKIVCEPAALSIIYPSGVTTDEKVSVRFSLEGEMLRAKFEVKSRELNAKKSLGPKESPFQFAVVERFVSASGAPTPYYEFELSPYDQEFQVFVRTPKGPFSDRPGIRTRHTVKRSTDGWVADLRIPLAEIQWNHDPKSIVGNAYAVLGANPPRRHWSLWLPAQEKPNFHKPEFFKPLFDCATR